MKCIYSLMLAFMSLAAHANPAAKNPAGFAPINKEIHGMAVELRKTKAKILESLKIIDGNLPHCAYWSLDALRGKLIYPLRAAIEKHTSAIEERAQILKQNFCSLDSWGEGEASVTSASQAVERGIFSISRAERESRLNYRIAEQCNQQTNDPQEVSRIEAEQRVAYENMKTGLENLLVELSDAHEFFVIGPDRIRDLCK